MLVAACTALTGTSALAAADDGQIPATTDVHRGLYVHAYGGLAYFEGREHHPIDYGRDTGSFSGPATSFGLSLGVAPKPRIILYAELVGATVSFPDCSAEQETDHLAQLGGGPGVAYYFNPSNAYVSATLTFSKVWLGDAGRTGLGYGLNMLIGRQWWVTTNMGLGFAAQVHLATLGHRFHGPGADAGYASTDDGNGRFNTGTFGVLVSATYN